MSLTATYDPQLSRVRLEGTALIAGTTALFERSKNGIYWTTVRGGSAVTIVGDDTANVDDYEFVPNSVNHYRVSSGNAAGASNSTTTTLAEDITTNETIWDITTSNANHVWPSGSNVDGLYEWMVGTEIVRVVNMTAAVGSGPYTQTATVNRSVNGVVTSHLTGASVSLYTSVFSTTITPSQPTDWIKSITRPFLNRAVEIINHSDITRPARNGIFEVKGRSFPVAVTDVRGSRQWSYTLKTTTPQDADALELVFASGDPLYFQIGTQYDIPGGYVVAGDVTRTRYGTVSDRRYFTVPVTEVAPPAATIVGATSTWETLLADYGSWNAVLAAFGTWADVAEYVADPSTVIVP